MNNRDRETISIAGQDRLIQITDDGSRTLIDPETQVAYHSASGAVSEAEHVYLNNSGVAELLDRWKYGNQPISVLEIGLGTGLTMLMTLSAAERRGCTIHYTAIERDLLDSQLLAELKLDRLVGEPGLVGRFLDWRKSLGNPVPVGVQDWDAAKGRQVSVCHVEAVMWADQRVNQLGETEQFDAIYFDPFAPDTNPELWRPEFLIHMHTLLRPACRLVTYCVSRKVRDAMESIGFRVQRVPGPSGGKREVMIATK